MFSYRRVVELSHVIHPGKERRPFEVELVGADRIDPNLPRAEGQWYVMGNLKHTAHVGTHIETPFHCLREGDDLSKIGADRLVGEAAVLDLRDVAAPGHAIALEEFQAAAEKAGGIRAGDIVLCHTGHSRHYGADAYARRPGFSGEALTWMVEQGVKLMGVDTGGIETREVPENAYHTILFSHGICLIENLANLAALTQPRVMVFALPLAVEGLEAIPLRVVALE
ncbi:cyclase family protein [Candidatus Sumerlaeota bacterium]|nr:cyclase family protein [Candidatus Sumerlaeota bacterium]